MAKHTYTYEEVHVRWADTRTLILNLRAMGYGNGSRSEAKDLHNLTLERVELRQWLTAQDQPVAV